MRVRARLRLRMRVRAIGECDRWMSIRVRGTRSKLGQLPTPRLNWCVYGVCVWEGRGVDKWCEKWGGGEGGVISGVRRGDGRGVIGW